MRLIVLLLVMMVVVREFVHHRSLRSTFALISYTLSTGCHHFGRCISSLLIHLSIVWLLIMHILVLLLLAKQIHLVLLLGLLLLMP